MSTAGPSASSSHPVLVAQGDWTKNLVHLAKTAELKKHALTLQLHTAQILSAHSNLDQKSKAIQDVKEQKNKLDSERNRLLASLREADMLESKLNEEANELQTKIKSIAEGEYAVAKADVDRLRQELGQEPLPSLQQTLEDKKAQFMNDLRVQQAEATVPSKRSSDEFTDGQPGSKRPRGRPKGSRTNKKQKNPPATPIFTTDPAQAAT
ncbi:hypothetical protein EW026_g4141 [Hermanssonia centrifuga]|uniref:Uncharacterized protein n=1 Tax=Hermanssonia centrifuga TaxID=98765 RepID=A0A4S4KI02_9APHY|nr:hypothetical protein EW026_g4141 [Hermanssonia centrifuga]